MKFIWWIAALYLECIYIGSLLNPKAQNSLPDLSITLVWNSRHNNVSYITQHCVALQIKTQIECCSTSKQILTAALPACLSGESPIFIVLLWDQQCWWNTNYVSPFFNLSENLCLRSLQWHVYQHQMLSVGTWYNNSLHQILFKTCTRNIVPLNKNSWCSKWLR